MELLPSSGEGREAPTLLRLLERPNLNLWPEVEISSFERIQQRRSPPAFYEIAFLLLFKLRMMDKVQKPSNYEVISLLAYYSTLEIQGKFSSETSA
jgi:hypothetical protein